MNFYELYQLIKEGLAEKNPKFLILLNEYKNLLNEKGINIENMKFLGAGDNGQAYLLQNGEVLKATSDDNELWIAKHLENKQYNYICKIYKVINFTHEIPKWDRWNNGNFGVIVQERIRPLDAMESETYRQAISIVSNNLPDSMNYTYPFISMSWDKIEKSNIENKTFQNAISILKNKFNFDKIIKDVKKSGVAIDDFHSGNLGKREDGTYVIFDLGGPNSKVRHDFY